MKDRAVGWTKDQLGEATGDRELEPGASTSLTARWARRPPRVWASVVWWAGGVGAALAAIFAIGSNVVVPGLGLVVAGPIAAALAGAGAGAAAGGLIGAMVGAGIPEDRAREYESGIREGGVLIGTRARDEAHAAELQRSLDSDTRRDWQSTFGLR